MRNLNFQNAVQRVEQKIPPIWMMRQAGRYHKHYQALRQKYSFMELCKIPELASEVAFGPVDEFDFDLAILFSDILFPLEGLGMGLDYTDHGPKLGWNLNTENFDKLKSVEEATEFMSFQKKAVELTCERIPKNKSVIGFVGGPWTLFTYAVMGKHEGGLIEAKKNLDLQSKFIKKITELLIQNIRLQLEGGAELIMIFDTASGELSIPEFRRLAFDPIYQISKHFPKKVGYYSKTTSELATEIMLSNDHLAGVGVDHRIDLPSIMKQNRLGFTQGNFDQALLFREKNDFLKTLEQYLEPFLALEPAERMGWVCGLGHGVLPKTPEVNVKLFVETVRKMFS